MIELGMPAPSGAAVMRALRLMLAGAAALFDSDIVRGFSKSEGADTAQAENALKLYGNSLLRLAFSYVHNMQDAEDVLQDSLIQYMRKAPAFESEAHEKAWLMRVTINLCKNRLRHSKRFREEELTEFVPDAHEADDLSFVWKCVKELPEKYSEVLHLYYYEGYSTAEIGKLLSKNETTVRSLLMRGRNMLKAPLEDVYGYEQ